MKKLDTLFHGTRELSHLMSIIKNGFHPSYAEEYIAGKVSKILMVSFSNIPLIEARYQVNYGDYFIGLSRNWGIKNRLHPVTYTYDRSDVEHIMSYLQMEAEPGALLKTIKADEQMEIIACYPNIPPYENIRRFNLKNLSNQNAEVIEDIYKTHRAMARLLSAYTKHFIVIDKNGNERLAYNDREWRYIPMEEKKKVILKEIYGPFKEREDKSYEMTFIENPDYTNINKLPKPHRTDITLNFDLEDINFIVIKEKNESSDIFNALSERFTENEVNQRIRSGDLTILSLDVVMNDL